MAATTERRYAIEEVSNGWLVKITESGSDKFVSRSVFIDLASLLEFLEKTLDANAGPKP